MTGVRLDHEVITSRLSVLLDAVVVLEKHADTRPEDLKRNVELRWTIQHGLLTCIQVVLDVSNHLVSALAAPTPSDYRGSILELGRIGVLPEQFANSIAPMAGLRNVIVHEYTSVDLEIIVAVLKDELEAFREFARYVRTFLEAEERP